MKKIEFRVNGIPKGQPRPRAFAKKLGNGRFAARVYDAGTAEEWKSCIAAAARRFIPREPAKGAVTLAMQFFFPRPKTHLRSNATQLRPTAPPYFTTKPDCDNLEKAVLDCLTTLGFWSDDKQIVAQTSSKSYGASPGAIISIFYIEDEVEIGGRR